MARGSSTPGASRIQKQSKWRSRLAKTRTRTHINAKQKSKHSAICTANTRQSPDLEHGLVITSLRLIFSEFTALPAAPTQAAWH
eukprot:6019195-Amphidinium_carterae.2